jgi:DNA modification methylase
VQLYSNANESVLTPFMGVGSEVYGAVIRGRKGIGIELKESYFNQSIKNLELASQHVEKYETMNMFEEVR